MKIIQAINEMQIEKHELDALNAELTIHVQPADYSDRVEKALKNYRKTVQLPGFRPGHVPASLIKQRYGKSILAEELNTLLQDSIYKYIAENKIQILGSPMPKNDQEEVGNWEQPGDFKFKYELGLAPSFDLTLDKKHAFTYYKVRVDEELINRQVKDYARRYGKMESPEVSEADDLLTVQLTELNSDGTVKENGITKVTTIYLDNIKDQDTLKKLVGVKAGAQATINPHHLTTNHNELAEMLGITHHDVHHLGEHFQADVQDIKRVIAHELNTELFDKIFGAGNVADEATFRSKVQEQLEKTFSHDSDYVFKRDFRREIVNMINPSLPDTFLKRFIMVTNEKPVTEEIVENEYPVYASQLRWQLIENKLVTDEGIRVTPEEARDHVKKILSERYAEYGLPMIDDEMLDTQANRALASKEESKQVYDFLYEEKMMQIVKEKCTIDTKELSLDEFIHHFQH